MLKTIYWMHQISIPKHPWDCYIYLHSVDFSGKCIGKYTKSHWSYGSVLKLFLTSWHNHAMRQHRIPYVKIWKISRVRKYWPKMDDNTILQAITIQLSNMVGSRCRSQQISGKSKIICADFFSHQQILFWISKDGRLGGFFTEMDLIFGLWKQSLELQKIDSMRDREKDPNAFQF